MTQKYLNDLTYSIIGSAIEVHKELGPGLLESVYEKCLLYLLRKHGLFVVTQQNIPLVFQGISLECTLRFDMLINDAVVAEIKSVDCLLPIHEAQLLTYMRLLGKPKGILLNFNCMNIFKGGQKTLVNELYLQLPKGY
jgi:GxxExxY protein